MRAKSLPQCVKLQILSRLTFFTTTLRICIQFQYKSHFIISHTVIIPIKRNTNQNVPLFAN